MCHDHRKITSGINVAKKNEATLIPDCTNNKNASEVISVWIFINHKYKIIYKRVRKTI